MSSFVRPMYDGPLFSFYVLDTHDVIAETGGQWDDFAYENNGAAAATGNVLGHSLWSMIQGREMRSFLNGVFFWCRQERVGFESLYRCDSPDEARLFRMIVESHDNGFLWVGHRFVTSSRKSMSVVELSERLQGARCDMCCYYKVGNEWIDPFAHPAPHDFPSKNVLCPSCKREARNGLFDQDDASVSQIFHAMGGRQVTSFP